MIRRTPLWQRAAAALLLLLTSPFLLVSALAVKISSRGPVIYRARRAQAGGGEFVMYKLRTMHVGSDSGGSITAGDDSRIFPVGRQLRRFKLDELPQLVNVVGGQMALVGPRPEATDIVASSYKPWMHETLRVPPGITGPGSLRFIQQERELPVDIKAAAQVYADVLLPHKLAYELVYIRNPTLGYEMQLMIRTVLGVIGVERLMRGRIQEESRRATAILAQVTRGEVR